VDETNQSINARNHEFYYTDNFPFGKSVNIYSTGGKPVLPEQVNVKTIATTLQGLNVIKEQGKGLMSFVESYRKLTRVPEPEKKFFKVADLMGRVHILYNSLDNSDRTKFSVSLKKHDLEIFADQNLISQV